MLRRCFTQLRTGRPGPVLLEIPSDILRQELPDDFNLDYQNIIPRKSAGDPQDIKTAAKMLLSSERPVLQAGQGVLYAEASDQLKRLAELTGIPVMTTMAGKSSFPETYIELALYGGEDYELLFTGNITAVNEAIQLLPEGACVIGEITDGTPGAISLVGEDGSERVATRQGWDHFT